MSAFLYLTFRDQVDLHTYFQFASDKTEAELIEHRRNVHALDRSLPHRAGRAYARLIRGERAPATSSALSDGSRISVRAIVRPEIDFRMLAKALLYTAMDQEKRRSDEEDQAA
ncbi:hypothetical protein BEL07_13005 [Mycolicibacterium grossiae]|uniref:Uncharacterized protein n=2 Tax=Mycolicibacterium grossiae TaxID=1552759 RepID=A0A1E8Q429_9MYCO|nr:hypothetical protein BEL07_13005 [Mycolicibacterium grossiae]